MNVIEMVKKFLGEKKRTVKPWTLWDNVIAERLNKNRSEFAPSRKHNVYANINGLYSGDRKVTYMYVIDDYNTKLELSFRRTLRRVCKAGVRMSFVTLMDRHTINWESRENKNKMKTWKHLDQTSNNDVSIFEMASEIGQIDNKNYKKDSLWYLINADKRRRRKLFSVQSVILVTGDRGQDFDDTIKDLEKQCKGVIKLKRITGNISDYLEVLSPFSLKTNSSVTNSIGVNVMTDEIVSRLHSYEQGTVGRGSMYWGTDIYSKKSILKEPKESDTDAENWLIAGETGSGKSYLSKTIVIELLGRDDVVGTVNDIEGDEYEDIGYIVAVSEKVVMLNIGDAGGCYFDPVEVHSTGVEKLDKDMFSLSYSFTIGIFKALLGKRILSNRDWAEAIVKNGVMSFYKSINVDRYNANSWSNSKGYSLFDVFEHMKTYKPENTNEEFEADRELVISTLEGYLGKEHRENGRFKKKISIDSIKDAKLIINSFGMKGRSEDTVDETDMALMQLYTALIAHLQSIFANSKGKYNFKIWEEFQRWGGFPGSEETLKTPLSGGRKLGDINIVLTNRPSELLDNDKFKIFDSITTFAIGAVADSQVRSRLCDRLGMPLMLKELDLIEKNRKKSNNETEDETLEMIRMNPYSKSFLFGLDRQDFAIGKISLPSSLSETKLFKTGSKTSAGVE